MRYKGDWLITKTLKDLRCACSTHSPPFQAYLLPLKVSPCARPVKNLRLRTNLSIMVTNICLFIIGRIIPYCIRAESGVFTYLVCSIYSCNLCIRRRPWSRILWDTHEHHSHRFLPTGYKLDFPHTWVHNTCRSESPGCTGELAASKSQECIEVWWTKDSMGES